MSQRPSKKTLKELYLKAKEAKVGELVCCPSCKTEFKKANYQQAFCKTRIGTVCKDYYWNNVTPTKRNNLSRISPANAAYMAKMADQRESRRDEDAIYDWPEGWDEHKDS